MTLKPVSNPAVMRGGAVVRVDVEVGRAYHWRPSSHRPAGEVVRMKQEMDELLRAIQAQDPARIITEAADVANFAYFIADNSTQQEQE